MTFHRTAAMRHTLNRPRPAGSLHARFAAAIVIVAVGAAPALAAGPAAAGDPDAARPAADRAFDAGRYTEALASYEALARRGDAGAARRAGELLLYGQGLLPVAPTCAAARAAAWLAVAAADGDEEARQLWTQAAGLPQATTCATVPTSGSTAAEATGRRRHHRPLSSTGTARSHT